jgi:hypothetical protein
MQEEVYTRLHLGVVNENVDFFSGRICFKGSSHYNLNILQECEMKNIATMATEFDNNIQGIVARLATGVEQFRNVIDGPPSMRNVVSDLSMALEDLPDKVSFC